MAIQMARAHLPRLLSRLEHHLPQSFMVHGHLKSHLRGRFPDVDFFVDRWPHPQAVVARTLPSGDQQVNNVAKGTMTIESMYHQNYKALTSLLWDPCVVDWNQRIVMAGVPPSLMPEFLAAAQKTKTLVFSEICMLMKATAQDLKPISVPEGVKLQPISASEIRIIFSTWAFACIRSEAYVQETAQRLPSMYLATEDGHHVGHIMSGYDGTMEALYVNPEFRRRGYAKVILSQLAQKYFDQGEDVYVCVAEENVASQNLQKSLGFRGVAGVKFGWVAYE